jgi:hypothetical protein
MRRIALLAAAVASIVFMLHAARNQKSVLLLLLFAAWTISPFVAAACAHILAARWRPRTRSALTFATVLLFLAVPIYADVAYVHTDVKIGFIFLVVPFASWIALGIVPAVALLSRSRD